MSLKRVLMCLVVTIAFVIAFCAVSFGEEPAYVSIENVDGETGVVTVEGNIGVEKARNVFLIVSEKSIEASQITGETVKEDADFIIQVTTDEKGFFAVSFKKDGDGWKEMADYVVRTSGAIKSENSFRFVSSTLEKSVLNEISRLTGAAFGEKLLSDEAFYEEYALNEYLGLDTADYLSIEDKAKVNDAVVSDIYGSIKELKTDFESKVKEQKKWETNFKIYEAVLNELKTATNETLDGLISKNSVVFEIYTEDEFGYAFLKERYDAGRDDGFKILMDSISSINDPMEASSKINDAIVLGVIKTAETVQLEDVLKHYREKLGIDFSDYDDLTTAQKKKAISLFKEKNIKSLSKAADAFEDSVKEAEDAQKESNGSKGGGGGKTSGGVYEMPVIDSAPAEQTKALFIDVSESHWAEDMINNLSAKKIINGYEDSTFRPEANILREEFVKIVVAGFGLLDSTAVCDFTDVTVDDWFCPYVASAKAKNIIQGSGTEFGSGNYITRQDAAVILYRVAELMGENDDSETEITFTDSSDISDYATVGISALNKASVINGYPDGTFRPNGNITRAEAASMIYKMMNGKGEAE